MARQPITESRLVARRQQNPNKALHDTLEEAVTVDLTSHQEPGDDGVNLPIWLRRTPSSRKRPLFERWRE